MNILKEKELSCSEYSERSDFNQLC